MFHRFRAAGDSPDWQGALSAEEFERILLYVGIDRILPPEEWTRRAAAGRLGRRDLCITFDDGLRSQVEHALPVLDHFGLRAFWFVYSCVFAGVPVRSEIYSYVAGKTGGMSSLAEEFLLACPAELLGQLDTPDFRTYAQRMAEAAPFYSATDIKYRFLRNLSRTRELFETVMDRIVEQHGFDVASFGNRLWMPETDLKRLTDAGHCVGLHSYSHPYDMTELSRADQLSEYGRNSAHITAVTGRAPQSVSHPLNAYNADSLDVLESLGVRCGFRANLLPPSSAGINPSPLELAREDSTNLLMMTKSPEALSLAAP